VITPPPGWTVERAGDGILLCPPEGAERALLRYVERRRPNQRAIDLAEAGPVPTGFMIDATDAPKPKRLVTAEGEHAALVTRIGSLAGHGYVLVYGYVFLDDYFSSLEGMCVPELVATVEELVLGDVHLLGRVRRRRFNYSPPPGWKPTADLFETRWSPPGAIDGSACIFVNPALPLLPGLVRGILDRFNAAHITPARFVTKHGLPGEHYAVGDLHLFFLIDQDFLYSVRADLDAEEGRALVESIEPVPRTQRASGEGLHYWAD
jgi:hypothetical protein